METGTGHHLNGSWNSSWQHSSFTQEKGGY